MNRTIALLFAFPALFAHAQNDCGTPLAITTGAHVIAGIDGSPTDVNCTQSSGNGTAAEWYAYTTAMDTLVTITTLTSGVDTRFHVYVGTCGGLQCVAGDDDAGEGNASSATFVAQAGVSYAIAFDDRWTADGFTFELVEAQTPSTSGQVTFTGQTMSGWTQGYPIGTVDMNGDHLDDIVAPGPTELFIAHQQAGGGFTTFNFPHPLITHNSVLCFAAGDLDENGFNDMLYGGGSGVSFMMANSDGTAYTEQSFPEFVFCQRTNMVDIDNDGNLDGFSCHDVGANVHYLGDGSGGLAFHQGQFGTTSGNYGSIWIDHDSDGDLDLYVTKCAGDPLDQLWNNNGDGTFTDVGPELGFAVLHQAWSSAWGDYDNDGDMDVLIGSSGTPDHRLFRNDLGSYTNVSAGAGFSLSTGSIEWRTHDFNNDGYLDILGNIGLFYNNGDLTFTAVPNEDLIGAVGDLNNDGFLDIMVLPNTLQVNDGNDNNWITVALQGTVSNPNGIGARVHVVSALGHQVRDIVSGDGFRFMSTLNAHFGIGQDAEIQQVEVHWPSGIIDIITAPSINGTLEVVEGLSTSLSPAAVLPVLQLSPNPASERLLISGATAANASVWICDLAGQCVLKGRLNGGAIDVSGLTPGAYTAMVEGVHARFVKE